MEHYGLDHGFKTKDGFGSGTQRNMNGQVMLGELMLGHNSDVAEFSQCSNFTKFVDVIALRGVRVLQIIKQIQIPTWRNFGQACERR